MCRCYWFCRDEGEIKLKPRWCNYYCGWEIENEYERVKVHYPSTVTLSLRTSL